MKTLKVKHSIWLRAAALFATLFGLLTIISGGSVLFNSQAQQAAGNYVPVVLWFNFLAGFAYIAVGIGLWFEQHWAVWPSFLIAGVTLVVFAIFGGHIWSGGAYELRTVAALGLRLMVWLIISTIAYRQLNSKSAAIRQSEI